MFRMKGNLNRIFTIVFCLVWGATGNTQVTSEVIEVEELVEWSSDGSSVALEGYVVDEIPYGVWEWVPSKPWNGAVLLVSESEWSMVADASTSLREQLMEMANRRGASWDWPATHLRSVHGNVQLTAPLLRFNPTNFSVEKLISFRIVLGQSAEIQETVASRLQSWPEQSVLSEGNLFRIAVPQEGVYKLGAAFWQSIGVDPSTISPESVTVFGNGGRLLPMDNDVPRPLDVSTVALKWRGPSGANHVGQGEFLFWAEGVHSVEWNSETSLFKHERNPYSDSSYYFVRIDDVAERPEARMVESSGIPSGVTPDTMLNTTIAFSFHEAELHSPNRSGREWYGEEFGIVTDRTVVFPVPHATATAGRVEVSVIARSIGGVSPFEVVAGESAQTLFPSATSESSTANVANVATAACIGSVVTGTGQNARIEVNLEFQPVNADARGWLDYVRIAQEVQLRFNGQPQPVWGAAVGPGWVRYEVGNANLLHEIWDITNPVQPELIAHEMEGEVAVFHALRDTMRRFVMMPDYGFQAPDVRGPMSSSNLHAWSGLDGVLITRPEYSEAAQRWADLRADEGLTVGVAFQQQVFNEFSSGQPDPTAIKMLMMMLWDRAESNGEGHPRFLQLMGDGTFANRGGLAASPYIITYQSENSLGPTSSYVSDDYFGFLEPEMGEGIGDKMAIGVGRFPCSNGQEALEMVEKLERYAGIGTASTSPCDWQSDLPEKGPWRNRICLVSDDMDGSGGPTELSHMMNSDEHGNTLASDFPEYDVDKIYFDAYPQIATPGGERYPDAAQAIDERVSDGALIINYIGHGGERGWAHERVLSTSMIRNWSNAYRMPLFMTATCELARFDDPEVESAGELMVLNPAGGAIGMLTTTRVVFSSSNQELNRAFYDVVLSEMEHPDLRLAEVVRFTKNDPQVSNTSNKRNFTLLGDASMRLAYPEHQVVLSEMPDSVRALDRFEGKGYVADAAGDTLHGFNGIVTVRVFDKRSTINTLNNDGGSAPYAYSVFRNVIHQGLASVQDGLFSFEFIVPRDIDYAWGTGRVSCYALDLESGEDAHGASENWAIGGVNEAFELDETPPTVRVYLNDTLFVSGGRSTADPILLVRAFDEGGINSAGSGIGHQMKAVVDGDWASSIALNDYYTSDLDTYKSGTVRLPLSGLAPGMHRIEVIMWDVQNNQGRGVVEFEVKDEEDAVFDLVAAYPNPAVDGVWFEIEHALACETVQYSLDAYDLAGHQMHHQAWEVESPGFRIPPLHWDLRTGNGAPVKPGAYICRITLQTIDGRTEQQSKQIVVLRP